MYCSQRDLLLPAIFPVFLYANCDGSFPTCFCVCEYHLKKMFNNFILVSSHHNRENVIVEIPSSCWGILILLLFWWTFWHLCCPPVSHSSLLATICVPHSCFFLGVVRAVLCMLVLLWQVTSGMKKGRCRGLKGLSAIYVKKYNLCVVLRWGNTDGSGCHSKFVGLLLCTERVV